MITFQKKGMLTTVQDLGRIGYQRYGMPVCGAMDRYAMELANILVNNPRSEAVIEATVMGPTIVFDEPEIFAITGGDFGPTLNGDPIENDRAYLAQAGDTLVLPMAKSGARAYIAFAGGLDIEEVMGSRSTFLKGGVGGLDGRPIRDGDGIGLRAPCDWLPDLEERYVPEKLRPALRDHIEVRFTYGPQDDLFSAREEDLYKKRLRPQRQERPHGLSDGRPRGGAGRRERREHHLRRHLLRRHPDHQRPAHRHDGG